MKPPHWDLERVKALAAAPNGLWVQIGRALRFLGDARSAQARVRNTIASLSARNFVETQQLTWNIADVYGVTVEDGSGWYLKLYIDEETQVTVISFHPLERPIKTCGGWIRP